ncbi:MAG: (d)CMP kinase [Deltaproteobacteria bacterium]|nr:(d)CMP kinase [Deltaproteobacteria bacterium]
MSRKQGVRPVVVAIDGPAGAGKSTISALVAERMGLVRVDTGAIYRALTLAVIEEGRTDDEAAACLGALDLRFEGGRCFLGTRDVSDEIRTPEVTARVSSVAAQPAVRAGLLSAQRQLGRAHGRGAVLEGRDIGTVVFPDADVKIFLTASAEARAERRLKELASRGVQSSFEAVRAALIERDRFDSERDVAPLVQAPDAICVDTTGKDIAQVVEEISVIVRDRLAALQ